MKKKLSVKFVDWWEDYNTSPLNHFLLLLTQKYEVEISDNPDVIFYSCFGREYLNYKCIRVFFSPENWRPNFTECDFAITFDNVKADNHLRLPLWAYYYFMYKWHFNLELFDKQMPMEFIKKDWKNRNKFCAFVVSNPHAKFRINFFQKLNTLKRVDSAGKHLNNVGFNIPTGTEKKFDFIKNYRFVIAFENEASVGYITEKIFEPIIAGCIPIYWGANNVSNDINHKRFINYSDFQSEEDLINYVLEVDRNEDLALKYLKEPIFTNEQKNIEQYHTDFQSFLEKIVLSLPTKKPIAKNSFFVYKNLANYNIHRAKAKLKRIKAKW